MSAVREYGRKSRPSTDLGLMPAMASLDGNTFQQGQGRGAGPGSHFKLGDMLARWTRHCSDTDTMKDGAVFLDFSMRKRPVLSVF